MKLTDKVWNLTKKIPAGKVSTYGVIACALGKPHSWCAATPAPIWRLFRVRRRTKRVLWKMTFICNICN